MQDTTEELKKKILEMSDDEKAKRTKYLYSQPSLQKEEFDELTLHTVKDVLSCKKLEKPIDIQYAIAAIKKVTELKEVLSNPERLPKYADRYPANEPSYCQAVNTFLRPYAHSNNINFSWDCQRIVEEADYRPFTTFLLEQKDIKTVGEVLLGVKIEHKAYEKYLLDLFLCCLSGNEPDLQHRELAFKISKIYMPLNFIITGKPEMIEELGLLDPQTIDMMFEKWFSALKILKSDNKEKADDQ
ncbi:hypothetical protein ENBRE01_3044 [Enteropsectra breve]|nr:hypothetical protein ENBRE01_3044 [Enteropsectra breve]